MLVVRTAGKTMRMGSKKLLNRAQRKRILWSIILTACEGQQGQEKKHPGALGTFDAGHGNDGTSVPIQSEDWSSEKSSLASHCYKRNLFKEFGLDLLDG